MNKSAGVTLYDYGRIIFAITVPVLINLHAKLNNGYLVLYTLIFIYSVGLLILQRQIPAVKIYTKFFIITDTILISLLLLLIQENSAFNFLYLLQLIGLAIDFGLPEILIAFYFQTGTHIILDLRSLQEFEIKYQLNEFITIFYILIIVFLLSKAWGKERKANREMVNKLNRRIQNARDICEISKFLSFPEIDLNLKQMICRVTLRDLEVDAGAVLINTGENFKLKATLQLSKDFEQQITDYNFLKFLRELVTQGEPLIINDTGNLDNDLLQYPLFSETLNKYGSVLIYPIVRNFISQVVIVFSKHQGYFTEERIEVYIETFDRSLFALARLQDNDTSRNDNLQDGQEKLLNIVSGLLARLFRAETCLTALFDGEEKTTVKGSFGDSHFNVGATLDPRDEIIYFTKMRNQVILVDEHSPKGLKRFNGVKFNTLISVPINSGTKVLGMITVINKHAEDFVSYANFNTEDQLLLITLANQIGLAIENQLLFKVQKETIVTTIQSLVQALDARDPYTKGHSEQVALYAVMIAKEMGLADSDIENIRFAGLLHDIGKIGIPEKLLNKPGKLAPNEFNQIKMHPYISAQILKHVPLFTSLLPFVYHHHERWDGKGYPDGLKGEDIPLGARILTVADAFDAMTSDRVYRHGKGKDAAVNELVKCATGQFDPRVVDALLTGMEKQLFEEKVDSVWKFDSLSNVFRDVINAVAIGKLVITDDRDIAGLKQEGEKLGEAIVKKPEDIGKTRLAIKDVLQIYNVPEQEINKILLCISEAATNMLKHASGGRLVWYLCDDGKIRFIAEDSGPGIKLSDLPKATLVKGPKKKKALGLGFTVLLELLNKVYLKTSSHGTTLVLEQKLDHRHAERKKSDKVG